MSTGQSCTTCAFRIVGNDQPIVMRQTIGSPICGKGHGPTSLVSANATQQALIENTKGKDCADYRAGAVRAGDVVNPTKTAAGAYPVVMLPDPRLLGVTAGASTPVSSCLQCANFIPPSDAYEYGLWNVGLCAARGIMIANIETTAAATDCDKKRIGPRDSRSLERMRMEPAYEIGMNIGTVPTGGFEIDTTPEIVEPSTYPTDKEVEDADKALGIRAWRKIEDPDSENFVHLPVYDLDFFDPEDRQGVPRTGDDEHPEQYVDHLGLVYKCAVLWMHLGETPALWGVAGTGKTEFYRHMAWIMCLPFHRISVTASTEVEDLAGKMHFEPSRGTYFEYGRIPRAWKSPGIICLDEPNVGPPDVWQFIRPLTDNSKQLVLDMNNGERIPKHQSAFLGLAMNPAWDVRNVGTGMLADADGSRLMHIFVDLPDAETERRIIKERCKLDGFDITNEQLDMVMRIAVDLRKLCEEDTLPITWGIRPQIKVARALRWFSVPHAYRLATADYLEPEQQQIILNTVTTNMAGPPAPPRRTAPRPGAGRRSPTI